IKPGLGNGTLVMTWLWNHSVPRCSASVFTAVGLTRVSIGPPIKVMDTGRYESRLRPARLVLEDALEMDELAERPLPHGRDLHRHALAADQRRGDAPFREAVAARR